MKLPSALYYPNNNLYMHQGNWTCSGCGGAITELPFQPRSETGLTCRTCYSKQKGGQANSTPQQTVATEVPDMPVEAGVAAGPQEDDGFGPAIPTNPSERPKVTGNWQCAGCGAAITSLPFTPRDTTNLKCIDCFKRSK